MGGATTPSSELVRKCVLVLYGPTSERSPFAEVGTIKASPLGPGTTGEADTVLVVGFLLVV